MQLLGVLLGNELIKNDADTPLLLTRLAEQLCGGGGGSRLLFKCTASECQQAAGTGDDELDGDEEVRKFAQKYRTDLARTLGVAARIVSEVQRRSAEHNLPHLSLSFGLVQIGEQEGLDSAIRRADQALYEAKRQGRNRVVWV